MIGVTCRHLNFTAFVMNITCPHAMQSRYRTRHEMFTNEDGAQKRFENIVFFCRYDSRAYVMLTF